MAKAKLTLPDGTIVTIDGTPEEVHRLLSLYGSGTEPKVSATNPGREKSKKKVVKPKSPKTKSPEDDTVDPMTIVNLIKNCDEAEEIEAEILDHTSQVNRTLLPLYIVHEHLDNAQSLTSGDINNICTDLGVPVGQPNVSRTLSGTASRYVIGDAVRKKGKAVRYKLARRGVQYMKDVLRGGGGEN